MWIRGILAVVVLLTVATAGSVLRAQPETSGPPGEAAAGQTDQPTAVAAPIIDDNPIPTRSLLQVIRDGGPLMVPIVLCSFVLLVFVFERTIFLRRGRVIPRPFVKRFLQQMREGRLDRQKALELCEKNRSPVAGVFAAAVRKWGRPSVEVEQAIIDAGERVTNDLRKYLRVLNGVSTISPLLGLLGTVLGMIRAFNAIATADAMGRPELLAGGISQALLTTAAGLSVAIPALIAYLYFSGRVDQLIMNLDALGQKIVDLISADGHLARQGALDRPASRSKRRDKAA
ncbi:MAG: MotA/TolQ/ExbB proton channel family protein [Planctomycetes bacterium]|nr:MotA/TolQ/ExbB proton channel family protein [Planctomycetota bacterium]MBL7041186.1 MotA/TolQ/ExbB proton channel family protein [Pirellulaceae bacterium]